jgi:hypothetical protein
MYNLQDEKNNLSWPPQNYRKKYLLKEIEAKKELVNYKKDVYKMMCHYKNNVVIQLFYND